MAKLIFGQAGRMAVLPGIDIAIGKYLIR